MEERLETILEQKEPVRVNAYPAILGKLHKSPIKFRFLACSAAYELKHLSVWLSRAFSFLSKDFHRLWKDALQVEGKRFDHHLPWVCSDSKVVPNMINHWNRSGKPGVKNKTSLIFGFSDKDPYFPGCLRCTRATVAASANGTSVPNVDC